MEYKDFLGNDIKPNDTIVYAVRSGDRAVMKQGRVIELAVKQGKYGLPDEPTLRLDVADSDRVVPFYSLKNCIVIAKGDVREQ